MNFAAFILTHGRPNNQKTYETLKKLGFKHKIYLVLDDQDPTIQQYIDNYGAENVIVFNKTFYIDRTDVGLERPVTKFAVYARNAIEDIANELGYQYFLMLDDDIYQFRLRKDVDGSLKTIHLDGMLDDIIDKCFEYVENAYLACLMPGVCNVYRCGVQALEWSNKYRISVNCFLRNGAYKVDWRLNMFEDLITDLDYNRYGQVWLTYVPLQIDVGAGNGKVEGGNTDTYKTFDGFKMAFLSVVSHPDCNDMGFYKDHWKPITHTETAINRIVSGRYRK